MRSYEVYVGLVVEAVLYVNAESLDDAEEAAAGLIHEHLEVQMPSKALEVNKVRITEMTTMEDGQ